MVLLIDNYDSFTFNLAQYLGELGAEVSVRRNDQITLDEIAALAPSRIVISPGPGRPEDAGVSIAAIQRFGASLPILGVCLGHQAMGAAFGGNVVRAPRLMHGKSSTIEHDGKGVFAGLTAPFPAARYHSLVVSEDGWPAVLEVAARTKRRRSHGDGAAPPRVADARRAVPPGVDPDRAKAAGCCATSWSCDVDVPGTAREAATAGRPERGRSRRGDGPRSWTATCRRRRSPAC